MSDKLLKIFFIIYTIFFPIFFIICTIFFSIFLVVDITIKDITGIIIDLVLILLNVFNIYASMK